MNKVLFNYLFTGYLRTILIVIMIFYCFGLILNLFEDPSLTVLLTDLKLLFDFNSLIFITSNLVTLSSN